MLFILFPRGSEEKQHLSKAETARMGRLKTISGFFVCHVKKMASKNPDIHKFSGPESGFPEFSDLGFISLGFIGPWLYRSYLQQPGSMPL